MSLLVRQAIDLYTQDLAIARDTSYRLGEGMAEQPGAVPSRLGGYRRHLLTGPGHRPRRGQGLGNLGLCRYYLGDYWQAIDLLTQALAIARDIGDRYNEANVLGYLGRAWLASGDEAQAVTLFEQAVNVADATGATEPAVEARSGLAQVYLQLDDPVAALAVMDAGRELPYPVGAPAMRLIEGLALLELDRLEESIRVFSNAVAAADALLALADSNIDALQTHALALSGLAAATGDLNRLRRWWRPSPGPELLPARQVWTQTLTACSPSSPPTTGPACSPTLDP